MAEPRVIWGGGGEWDIWGLRQVFKKRPSAGCFFSSVFAVIAGVGWWLRRFPACWVLGGGGFFHPPGSQHPRGHPPVGSETAPS